MSKGKFFGTFEHTPCKTCGAQRVCYDYDDDAYINAGILVKGCGVVSTFARFPGDTDSYSGEVPPYQSWIDETKTCRHCNGALSIKSEGFSYGCVTRAVCEDWVKKVEGCADCRQEGHWI